MRAGQLRHQVDIRQFTGASDGAGGVTDTWTNFASGVWANIVETVMRRGAEKVEAMAIDAHAPVIVTIRYIPGVTTKMRVYYDSAEGTDIFEIVGVTKTGQRDFELVLTCEERVA
jgi:SPP1 family predicted phage head-tail adaptor